MEAKAEVRGTDPPQVRSLFAHYLQEEALHEVSRYHPFFLVWVEDPILKRDSSQLMLNLVYCGPTPLQLSIALVLPMLSLVLPALPFGLPDLSLVLPSLILFLPGLTFRFPVLGSVLSSLNLVLPGLTFLFPISRTKGVPTGASDIV